MNGRVDKSMGIVTLIARLVKLKPTEPLRLAKHAARRKRNLSDSSGNSPAKAIASRCACKKSKRTKSFLNKSTSTMMLQGDTGTPSEADLKAFVSLGMDAMLAGGASAVAHLSVDAIRDLTLAVRRKGVTVSQARALHMRLCKPGDKVGATIYMRGGAKGHWAGWDSLTPAAQETLRDIILKHAKASARKGGLKGGGSLAARASLPKARQAAVVVKQAVDMWEALLFTRLAAVASPGGLGYALEQSGDINSWLNGIAADLLVQSSANKCIALKKQGISPRLQYKDANRLFKAANRKGKPNPTRSNNPTTVKEAKEAENKAKMKYIQEFAFPLPKKAGPCPFNELIA